MPATDEDNPFAVYPEKNAGNWDTDPLGEEPSGKHPAASTSNTFARDREIQSQKTIAEGGDIPRGHYPSVAANSTRVDSYRYVPNNPEDDSDSGLGTLYVRFIKKGTKWKYDNVSKGVYEAFSTDGVSKGRFINSTLNPITSNGSPSTEADDLFMYGM